MHKRLFKILSVLVVMSLLLCITPIGIFDTALAVSAEQHIRVGLYYSDDAVPSTNLKNSVGAGYYFGYYNSNEQFAYLMDTDETAITILKNKNMYVLNGYYYEEGKQPSSAKAIGSYTIDSGFTYYNINDANTTLGQLKQFGWNVYIAYVNGAYRIRIDSYKSIDDAQLAYSQYAFAGSYIVPPSDTCITVAKTSTGEILFQYDCSNSTCLGILPKGTGASNERLLTTNGSNKYAGGFEFRRNFANDITVINVLSIEDYVKGVLPYEMPSSWHAEALKAQAIAIRTFCIFNITKHSSYGFDLCNTTDCRRNCYGI